MKTIPIIEAEKIAKRYGFQQIVIIARAVGDDGNEAVVTYGVTKQHCSVAKRIGEFLMYEIMKWEKTA